jgi:hypothetical protein
LQNICDRGFIFENKKQKCFEDTNTNHPYIKENQMFRRINKGAVSVIISGKGKTVKRASPAQKPQQKTGRNKKSKS